MIAALIRASIRNRFLVLMGAVLLAGWGVWAMLHMPLDLTAQMNDTAKACSPLLFFSGTKALVSTCPAPSSVLPDAGTDVGHDVGLDVGGADAGPAGPAASVVLIDPSGSYTTLRSNVDNAITPSKAGDKFFVVDLSGNASVQPVDGSAAIAIDTGVSFGGINPEGTTAIYAPTAGGLKAASVSATPAPITLSSTKVAVFYTPIMGEKYMYFGNNYVPNAGTSDLQLIPLTGGTAVTLDSATDGALFGDRFTADGKYAVFYTSVATGTGNLTVKDVSVATDKGKQLTSAVWTGYSPKGSMLTYNDNWQTGGTGVNGTADIRLIDVSSPATNKLVAAQADDNFYLSNDKTKIVFVTSDPSFIKSGAYVANVP